MKIFIGKNISCTLNYQYEYIYIQLASNFEITENVEDADKIVFVGTCTTTEFHILDTLKYINKILERKKDGAKTYLTGCITRKFIDNENLNFVKDYLRNNIDYIIPHNNPNELLKLVSQETFKNEARDDFGYYNTYQNISKLYISNGCLNRCSFCKLTFQDYPLKSVKLDEVKNAIDCINKKGIKNVNILGTNISQYGLDLYNKYMLPEVIEYLEAKNSIKNVSLIGFSFKDAIKGNFKYSLKDSTKIKILSGSLESGSDRILKLINKGFFSQEIIDFYYYINQIHEKKLHLNIIAGFPTETLEDIKITLEVLKRLNPYHVDICRYTNSSFTDSNNFEKLNIDQIQNNARIYSKVLTNREVSNRINGSFYKYNK